LHERLHGGLHAVSASAQFFSFTPSPFHPFTSTPALPPPFAALPPADTSTHCRRLAGKRGLPDCPESYALRSPFPPRIAGSVSLWYN